MTTEATNGERILGDLARELLHWARDADLPERRRRQVELLCKAVLEGEMALKLYARTRVDCTEG